MVDRRAKWARMHSHLEVKAADGRHMRNCAGDPITVCAGMPSKQHAHGHARCVLSAVELLHYVVSHHTAICIYVVLTRSRFSFLKLNLHFRVGHSILNTPNSANLGRAGLANRHFDITTSHNRMRLLYFSP